MTEQSSSPNEMFQIDPAEIARLFPSIEQVRAAGTSAIIGEQSDLGGSTTPSPSLVDLKNRATRGDLRAKSPMTAAMQRMAKTGAALVASYADHEEGLAAARAATEGALGDTDRVFETLFEAISMGGTLIRRMRVTAQQAALEMAATQSSGPDRSYTLLKILAGSYQKKGRQSLDQLIKTADDVTEGRVLIRLGIISGSEVPQQLAVDLNSGMFDSLIARDMLVFADRYRGDNEALRRLKQLGRFVVAVGGIEPESTSAFYERLSAVVGDWPTGERDIVVQQRLALRQSVDFNLADVGRGLRESGLLSDEDPTEAFERSLDALIDDLIKRTSGDSKIELLKLRTKRRVPRQLQVRAKSPDAKKRAAPPDPEVRRDPIVLVSCNLQEGTATEGVESMVAAYLEEIGQQGNTTIREDIERMLRHMARTDLPTTQRRGIKNLEYVALRFGEDEKLWDVYELKPSEAAGLSLRSDAAKNSRVYFVKLSDTTWGVFGISLRSAQEAFLRSTCEKARRRR